MVDLSHKLSDNFVTLGGTLKEIKDCTKQIIQMFKRFNNSIEEDPFKVNEDIFTCLNSTFSNWCGHASNQSRVISRFMQKTFDYTGKEIQALNEVTLGYNYLSSSKPEMTPRVNFSITGSTLIQRRRDYSAKV